MGCLSAKLIIDGRAACLIFLLTVTNHLARTLLMIMTASSSSGHWPLVSAALFLLGGADMLLVTGSRSLGLTDLLLSHLHRAG